MSLLRKAQRQRLLWIIITCIVTVSMLLSLVQLFPYS